MGLPGKSRLHQLRGKVEERIHPSHEVGRWIDVRGSIQSVQCSGCGSGAFVDPDAGEGAFDEVLSDPCPAIAVGHEGRLSVEEPGGFFNAIDEGEVP
jgi:hypothetical protein